MSFKEQKWSKNVPCEDLNVLNVWALEQLLLSEVWLMKSQKITEDCNEGETEKTMNQGLEINFNRINSFIIQLSLTV